MKRIGLYCAALFLTTQMSYAQEDEIIDSTKVVGLSDVVITGQYSAQSVDKSLYQVEVITAEDIKNQAGNTVADILSLALNVLIIPNGQNGDSQVSIMGLDSGYTKILVDNIPIIGDNGLGNYIDLTKINLDNVERIEIVKGAMGVDYGSNALAGVINIITKKNIQKKWKINAFVQEETVGDEYDWYEDGGVSKGKGRHIQSLEVSHKISEKWLVSVGANRNDFQGFWGERKGKQHIDTSNPQDNLRGYEWLPKEQINAHALLSYKSKNFSAFYKGNFMTEEVNYFSPTITEEPLGGAERTYISNNTDYRTYRWVHHLNLSANLFEKVKYMGDFSYQSQERQSRTYAYDVPNRVNYTHAEYARYLQSEAFYSRGTFSNFLKNNWINFQVGYELDNTKGYRAKISGVFDNEIDKSIGSYAGFLSAEINTGTGLFIRPGFRASFSNIFENIYNYSVSSKFDFSSHSNLRFVIGTANRYPVFDELYTYFVDANHDVRGNENLVPEKGYSTSIQWNYKTNGAGVKSTHNISTLYLDNDDRIELAAINFNPLQYQYINIDKYKSWGISTANRFIIGDFDLNLGASLIGISRRLDSNEIDPNDEFRYSIEANAAANYTFPKWATTLSLYYKYNGRSTQYVMEGGLTEEAYYRLGEQEDFNLMNFSVRKGFLDNKFELTLGARNIFDVTSIQNTTQPGSAHSDAASQQMLFYGRSYFLKLNFNLDF